MTVMPYLWRCISLIKIKHEKFRVFILVGSRINFIFIPEALSKDRIHELPIDVQCMGPHWDLAESQKKTPEYNINYSININCNTN